MGSVFKFIRLSARNNFFTFTLLNWVSTEVNDGKVSSKFDFFPSSIFFIKNLVCVYRAKESDFKKSESECLWPVLLGRGS